MIRVYLDNDLVYNLKNFFSSQKNITELEIYFNYTAMYALWIQEIFESMNFNNLKSVTFGLRACGLDEDSILRFAKMVGTIDVQEGISLDLGQ